MTTKVKEHKKVWIDVKEYMFKKVVNSDKG